MVRLVFLILCLVLVGPAWAAPANEVTDATFKGLEGIIRGPVIAILCGALVIWLIISIVRSLYLQALTAGISLLLLFMTLVFTHTGGWAVYDVGQTGVTGFNAAQAPGKFTMDWVTYGQSVPELQQTDLNPGYTVVRGWAGSAAVWVNKIMIWLFTSGLLPIFVIGCMVYACVRTIIARTFWPALTAFLVIFLWGTFCLWPVVKVMPINSNPVVYVMSSVSNVPADVQPRIPMVAAWTFQGANAIAESVGKQLAIADQGPHQTILKASMSARLESDTWDAYRRFSENCFLSAVNVNLVKQGNVPLSAHASLMTNLPTRIKTWNKEFKANQHALSKASDMLFKDLDYDTYIFNEDGIMDSDSASQFYYDAESLEGSYRVDRVPDEGEKHAGPTINQRWFRHDNWGGNVGDEDFSAVQNTFGANHGTKGMFGMMKEVFVQSRDTCSWMKLDKRLNHPVMSRTDMAWGRLMPAASGSVAQLPYWRVFCSCENSPDFNLELNKPAHAADVDRTIKPASLRDVFPTDTADGAAALRRIEALDAGDYVRFLMARRYTWTQDSPTRDVCRNAAKEGGNNKDLWGCFVAGHYNSYVTAVDIAKFGHIIEAQKLFDSKYRPLLDNMTNNASVTDNKARVVATSFPYQTGRGMSWTAPLGGSFWPEARYWVDTYMLAPGIQTQVGLMTQNASSMNAEEANRKGNMITKDFNSLGSAMGGGMAWLFAWVGNFMANLAMQLWPYVMGLATFFLLLSIIPYGLMSIVPGKWGVILEWGKGVLWVSTWPVLISLGVALMNRGSGFGLDTLFIQADGGQDIGLSMYKIFGAMLVIGAPSFSAMLIILGMNGILSGIGSLISSSFKVASFGLKLPITLGATVAGGIAGMVMGRMTGGLLGGGGGGGGGGGNPITTLTKSVEKLTKAMDELKDGMTVDPGTSPSGGLPGSRPARSGASSTTAGQRVASAPTTTSSLSTQEIVTTNRRVDTTDEGSTGAAGGGVRRVSTVTSNSTAGSPMADLTGTEKPSRRGLDDGRGAPKGTRKDDGPSGNV